MNKIGKYSGVTLIELMVSMVLGVIISTVSLQSFLTIKQLYLKQNAISRIQENARIINIVLGEAIESSGKLGCNALTSDMSVGISPDINKDAILPISSIMGLQFKDITQVPNLSQHSLARIKPKSDLLLVKSAKSVFPVQHIDVSNNHIQVRGYFNVVKGQILVLSDCSQSVFVKAREVEHKRGTTSIRSSLLNKVNNSFSKSGTIGILSLQLFYVGITKRENANGKPIQALYVTDLNGRTVELVEGIEAMEIYYGVPSGKGIAYCSAEQISDWQSISTVRVSLLLNSIEDALMEPREDRLMRMWWHYEWSIKGHT